MDQSKLDSISETRHFTLKNMVELNELHATTELVHVIKRLDMFLKCHTSEMTKLVMSEKTYFLKTNLNVFQLFEMDYLLLFFLHLIPVHNNMYLLG